MNDITFTNTYKRKRRAQGNFILLYSVFIALLYLVLALTDTPDGISATPGSASGIHITGEYKIPDHNQPLVKTNSTASHSEIKSRSLHNQGGIVVYPYTTTLNSADTQTIISAGIH